MGMIELSGSPDVASNDYVMARDMAEALHAAYPGHLWAVTCEGDKGVATVRNLALAGNWGFVLRLPEIYSASSWKKLVLSCGGELLERFRLRRGVADEDEIAALAHDFTGKTIGDYST